VLAVVIGSAVLKGVSVVEPIELSPRIIVDVSSVLILSEDDLILVVASDDVEAYVEDEITLSVPAVTIVAGTVVVASETSCVFVFSSVAKLV
jgi:hypothetical protein